MATPTIVLDAHEKYGLPLGFTSDSETLVTGGFDGSLASWELPEGDQRATTQGNDQSVNSGAITSDGRLVTGSTDRTLGIWTLPDLDPLGALTGHSKTVASVAAHPDDPLVASGSYDATVRAWHLDADADPTILRGHQGNVTSVAFVNEGANLLSGGLGDEALAWDVDTDMPVARFTGHGKAVVAVATGDTGAWTAGYNGQVRRVDIEEWTVADSFELPGGAIPTGLAVNPAAGSLAVTKDAGVFHLDAGGELLEEHQIDIKGVYSPRWSPDGELLAVGGADGQVRIYD